VALTEVKQEVVKKAEAPPAAPQKKVVKIKTAIGTIKVADFSNPIQSINVYEQQTGKHVGSFMIFIKQPLTVPAGSYRLEFYKVPVEVEVEAGQEVVIEQ
jgi:hypothetical protein